MSRFYNIFLVVLVLVAIAAHPLASRSTSAVAQLIAIAPTSDSCDNAPFLSECATALQAAPHLIAAFSHYGITAVPEITALLALIAYETGDFKYNINHYPGRPGQGTRNMQMPPFNLLYARSIPALSTSLDAITTGDTVDGLGDDELNAVRALVLPDAYAWGSAAWFLTTQCSEEVRSTLRTGGQAGFESYMGCVGTTATSDRLAYWERANTAFGVSSIS